MDSVQLRPSVLPDISQVDALSEEDETCMNDLVEVLRRHKKLTRFGVTLLHQHFYVAEDEILMETCDPENRVLSITPVKKSELASAKYKETSWRLDTRKPLMNCICRVDPDTGNHNHYHVRKP